MSEITSLIYAIATLAGVAVLGVFLLRRPGASLRMRHKDTELEIQERLPSPAPEATMEAEVQVESRFQKAFKLLNSGAYEDGMKLFEEEARTKPNLDEQVSLIAFAQSLAAEKGSKAALGDLRRTAQDHPGIYEPHLWLGIALVNLGIAEDAESALLQAYKNATSDGDRATALIWRARNRARTQINSAETIAELLNSSRKLREHQPLSRIYRFAAEMALKSEPPDIDRGFALYELAIQFAPADVSLRFDVAYAYSEKDAPAIALLHYHNLLQRNSEHLGGLNNFAVAASDLGLESIAIEYYRRAEDLGYTLATANLAWRLINAGFVTDARAKLEPKVCLPGVHPNVLEALGGVAKRASKDEDGRDRILKSAEKIRVIRARIGEGLASGAALGPGTTSVYSDGATTFRITEFSSNNVKGELSTVGEAWDLSGTAVGPGILFKWERRKPEAESVFLSSLLGGKKGHGVFVLKGDSFTGFTYEGDRQVDPSRATNLKDWHLHRQG
jgi:tetratricopeptide (TPR) repeat protein